MRIFALSALVALAACGDEATGQTVAPEATFQGPVVVAAHPLASAAGVEILAAGGSAVDAAVAIEATLSLVEPQSSGLAGGAFMMFYDAETGEITAYDGREVAPMGATPELFLNEDGNPLGFLAAKNSGLSVGVPGVVDMLALAHEDHGALPWSELFAPARRHAWDGFEVTPRLNALINSSAQIGLRAGAETGDYFFTSQGDAIPVGTRLRNRDYALTLDAIAADPRAMYEGPLAEQIVAAVQAGDNGGSMTTEDLAAYRARRLEPVCAPYHEVTVCGPPTPSSGGIVVNEALGVLSHFTFSEDGPNDPANWGLVAEALRLGMTDWAVHIGDERFVEVPVDGLLHPDYLAERAALVSTENAMTSVAPGDPWAYSNRARPDANGDDATVDRPGTSHFVVVDADGNVVSMTATVEGAFGSMRMAGGMILNNELTDFSFRPVDSQDRPVANAVAPGKGPRSSMSPTIVLDQDGEFLFATGSPGGASIISYTVKSLVGVLDWGLTPQEAIDLPNVVPGRSGVRVESARALPGLIDGLRDYGLTVQESAGETSGLHSVLRLEDGSYVAGVDPRREGVAMTP
ncbi:MAG: gamma-glutamyltransferase [Maricaulaceae bacterium]